MSNNIKRRQERTDARGNSDNPRFAPKHVDRIGFVEKDCRVGGDRVASKIDNLHRVALDADDGAQDLPASFEHESLVWTENKDDPIRVVRPGEKLIRILMRNNGHGQLCVFKATATRVRICSANDFALRISASRAARTLDSLWLERS